MTQYRWKVFAPLAALCLLIVALPAATSTITTTITAAARSANRTAALNPAPQRASAARPATSPALQPATSPGATFVPGLPLFDNSGSSTGAAEPSIRVDAEGHIYVTGPAGVPTGGCPFWRVHPDFQNAKGLPYEYLGKFDTDHGAAGGGDCDIATGGLTPTTPTTPTGFDNLAVSSLSLGNLTTNQSADGGATFHTPANSAGQQVFGDDRQWNAADSGIGQVYMTVHDLATDNIQDSSSTDGGYTYTSHRPAIDATPGSCGQTLPDSCATVAALDNHFGNIVVNQRTHTLYTIYVAPANAGENRAAQMNGAPPNEHVVYVAIGVPSCGINGVADCAPGKPILDISWTDHVVYTGPSGIDLAHIFPVIGIDKAGTVYTAWSDDPNMTATTTMSPTIRPANHIFMSHSTTTTPGDSWTKPVQVDKGPSHSNMFPWLVAGAAGALDVVWYSAQLNGNSGDPCPTGVASTEPTDDANGVNNNCHNVWTMQFAQSLNANLNPDLATPTFTQSPASDVIHRGSLCDQGLNCSLFGGDRTLLDYFQVDLDPAGAANIAYASDVAHPGSADIDYTRQCTGTSATTGSAINYPCGSLLPPPPPGPSCNGVNVVTDPTGDASNPLGLADPTGGNNSQVDITNVSFSTDSAHTVLTTTMTLANLSLTPVNGTSDTYYYVVWTYPGNGKTYATLASEPDPSGRFAYSYGEFNPSNNQLITPIATTGAMTTGPNGTISVVVQLSDVGNPAIPVDPSTNPNAVPAVVAPYGLTISGEGALGAGLIFVKPDDRAPNTGGGASYAVCPTGSGSPTATAGSPTAVAATGTPSASPTTTAGGSGGGIGFGNTTLVEDQREAAEPDVKVCGPGSGWSYANCGLDNPYVSWPFGFSTTSSFISRSQDQGQTFKLVPNNNGTGKPDACPGGGDTDLGVSPGVTQTHDFLSFIDLQGLTNFSSGVSPDGGKTFTADCASSLAAPVDRQWFGFYGNQANNTGTASISTTLPTTGTNPATYLDYDVVAGATTATSCVNDIVAGNAGGNVFVVQKSTDGGLTYGAPVVADCNDGIAGNMQVNQTNGHVFAIHTAYSNSSGSGPTDVVTVNKSTDGGATWTKTVAFSPTVARSGTCSPDCTVGQDFAVLAIDKVGGLYAVWSQATVAATSTITGPSHIYYSHSEDEGAHWAPEQQVDAGGVMPGTGTPTNVDIFPWVAAGNAGRIDIVWYGTSSITNSLDSGSQISDWYPFLTQSTNARSGGAIFSTPVPVSQHPNHNGGICTMGISCTTGGDRSLADFFQVDVNKAGGADVIFADTSNNSNTSQSGNQSALVDEARQISGPTLFGPTLSGIATTCTAVTGTPCQADVTGDATYEANGLIGANVPKLDITGSSLNISPTDPLSLDVRMNIADLSTLPMSPTDTTINANDLYVDYLTSWNYHAVTGTQATYDSTGNIYYAYLEVNRVTGAVTAYDGNTCGVVAGTRDKFLTYPGQNRIGYSIDNAAKTIDLYVPRADVGSPADGASLFSVTAHTVGQPAAAGPANCTTRDLNGNNVAAGQLFDVYDKSPAYTSILASGAVVTPGPSATGTTGTTAVPSVIGTAVPSVIGTTAVPSATGTTAVPSATGTTAVPSATGTTGTTAVPSVIGTAVPSVIGTGTTAVPSATGATGTTAVPSATGATGTTAVPSATGTTGTTVAPSATGTTPSATGTTAVPSATGTTPSATGTTAVPSATGVTGTTAVPSATGTTGATGTTPSATGTMAVPSTTGTAAGPPPATNTATATNTQAPPAPTATNTPSVPTATATNTPSPTATTPSAGNTATATATATAVPPTGTAAPATSATNTPSSGNSSSGPVATLTAAAENSATVQASSTSVSAGLPNPTPPYRPRITLAPTSAHVGDLITVLGSAFAGGEQVTLALNGEGLSAEPVVITTARDGTFTATFRAPSGLLQGANTVSAIGTTSQRTAVATLTGLGGFPAQAYFAGGLETSSEHSFLSVLNPSGQQARVRLTFYSQTSDRDSMEVTVPAHTRMVMPVARLTRLHGTFGLALTADQRVASQLGITRDGRDGDVLLGAPGLAQTWNLAEGYTGLTFHETVSILNPDGQHAARVRLRVLPFGGRPGRTITVTVQAHTNAVVDINRVLPHLSVSVLAEADRPVVVERTLTFGRDGHGHDYGLTTRIGTTTTSRVWLFAEGTTANHFETYLTILNPNARAARVAARFYDRNGRLLRSANIRVAGLSRANIRLNGLLRASGVASIVTNDQPIVVERPEYFGSPNGTRIAGSDVFGRNGAGTRWSFAGGDTRPGQSEFLLLYNPAAVTARVRATLYGTDGRTVQKDLSLEPNARATVDVGRAFGGARGLHGVTLVSLNGYGFIAEQTAFASNHTTLQSTQGLAQ